MQKSCPREAYNFLTNDFHIWGWNEKRRQWHYYFFFFFFLAMKRAFKCVNLATAGGTGGNKVRMQPASFICVLPAFRRCELRTKNKCLRDETKDRGRKACACSLAYIMCSGQRRAACWDIFSPVNFIKPVSAALCFHQTELHYYK